MDAIVSARVPIALKERGNDVLREIGATPTQLINAAYEFILSERELPKTHRHFEDIKDKKRELTPQQREKIQLALQTMYVGPVPDGTPFKEQLNNARDERYADLA